MDHWDLDFETTLADSEAMLNNAARSLDDSDSYSLDSILAEFGDKGASEPVKAPQPTQQGESSAEDAAPILLEDADAEEVSAPAEDVPEAPSGVTLQDVLEQTVQTVLSEQEHEPVL